MNSIAKFASAGLLAWLCLAWPIQSSIADRPSNPRRQAQPPADGQTKNTPSDKKNQPKVLKYGEVLISNYLQSKGSLDFTVVTFTGPNTIIDAPDKASGSHLLLHADQVTVTGINKPGHEHVEMRGRLKYTLTQPTPEGPRKLTGTAGQGDYRSDSKRIVLTNAVHCEMTDPRLDGPGTLHVGKVTVDITSSPYLYTFEGEEATNDIRFSPRPRQSKQPANNGGAQKPIAAQIGMVHITRWADGTFQAGKSARFQGALVVADLHSRDGKPLGQLKGRELEGNFAPGGEIVKAHAKDSVQYHFERAIARKAADGKVENGREEITGSSHDAIYEPNEGRVTLDGDVDSTLVNTLTMEAPAKLLAARVVVIEPAEGNDRKVARYEITGSPNRRRLEVSPKRPVAKPPDASAPAAAPGAQPATPPAFLLGNVVLKGFQSVVLDLGQDLDIKSDGNQMLLIDTVDPKTKAASHVETHHLTAKLAESGVITDAESEGAATFHFQQPGPPKQVQAVGNTPARTIPGQMQSVDGTTAKAVFKAEGTGRLISLQGPFSALVTDPDHLATPASLKGLKDETLSLDLVTREFVMDTPHETGVLVIVPRPPEQTGDKPATPPKGKRKK